MPTIRQLSDERISVARQMRALLDNHPGSRWGASQQKTYDAGIAQLESLDDRIATARRTRDGDADARMLDAILQTSRASDGAILCASFLRGGFECFTAEQTNAYYNTMSTTTGSQGGFSVASDVSRRYVDTMKDYSGVRRVAEIVVTERGNTCRGRRPTERPRSASCWWKMPPSLRQIRYSAVRRCQRTSIPPG